LIEDKNSSNIILENILLNLEQLVYLLGYNEKKNFYFTNYKLYYLSEKLSINEIVRQLSTQLEVFERKYKDFIKKYGEYQFPGDLKLEEIIQIVNKWSQRVGYNNNYYKYFKIFLDILSRRFSFLEDKYNKLNNNHYYKDFPYKEESCIGKNSININNFRDFPFKEDYIEKKNKKINYKEDYFKNYHNNKIDNNIYLNSFEKEFISYKKNDKKYINNYYSKDNHNKNNKKCDCFEIKSKCPCKYCGGKGEEITQWKCQNCHENELLNEEGKIICPNCRKEKFIWEKTFKCGKNSNNYNEICFQGILNNLSQIRYINNIPEEFIGKLAKKCLEHIKDFSS
jgi:hypothetical protein